MLKDTHFLFYCSHCGTEATRAERVGLALDHASYDLINCAGDETPAGVIEIAHLLIAFARVDEAREELSLRSIDATALAHEARLITSPGARQDRHVLRQIRYGQTVIAILQAAQRIASRRLARHIALDDIVIALLQSEDGDPGVVLMQRYARRSGPAEISQLPEPYYSSMVREQPTASQRWQRAHPDDADYGVAQIIAEYNLLALPVVDDTGDICGIVTVDDAMDLLLPKDWKQRLPRVFA